MSLTASLHSGLIARGSAPDMSDDFSSSAGPLRIIELEALLSEQQQEITELRRENDELKTDPLTKIPNRHAFNKELEIEQNRLNAGQSDGGVIVFIDLNGFKDINDRLGHEMGDKCLAFVGGLLKQLVRNTDLITNNRERNDVAARLGGDEFVIILKDTTLEKSGSRLNELKATMNCMALFHEKGMAQIRASLGFVEYKQGDVLLDCLNQADAEMYADKKTRRLTSHAGVPANANISTPESHI